MRAAHRDARIFCSGEGITIEGDRGVCPGYGIQECLGIHVARTEMRTALEELFARYPDHEIDPSRSRRPIFSMPRGVANLQMRPGTHA